eukprot:TRINITY_DN12890_c0_g1_i2.p1 TRINITY_DN12890_c0_g1~~TRINITY_DN12890_c0_g1_i2.p1  ORF type:complete len:211 (+),score=1.39 TRINITY_DN12890_c0_g1_i2:91-723(+)
METLGWEQPNPSKLSGLVSFHSVKNTCIYVKLKKLAALCYSCLRSLLEVIHLKKKKKIHWISSKYCQICDAKFTITRRRNHCRRCGRCVCADCSDETGCYKVCSECALIYVNPIEIALILKRYPDRIPITVICYENGLRLRDETLYVYRDCTWQHLKEAVHHLCSTEHDIEELRLSIGKKIPKENSSISSIYKTYKCDDNMLYVVLSTEL